MHPQFEEAPGKEQRNVKCRRMFTIVAVLLLIAGFTSTVAAQRPSLTPAGQGDSGNSTVVYVVRRGDTLSAIARRFGTTVSAIVAANPSITNRNRIYIGQRLIIPLQPAQSPPDIGPSHYLDDRSTPEAVLRSFFNAINRKEYARAYSYWEPQAAASELPPFPQFEQGYANTESVELTTGTVQSGAAAGNFFYSAPVTLVAKTSNGTTQTFVGCYTLHLANPGVQAVPPFQPMGIRSATVQPVSNNADTAALMSQACPQQ